MRRLALLVLALALVAPALVAAPRADAAVPCRNTIYNDWYADGKIATTYPIACYRDALRHVKADARIYSSLVDDIRSAMQGALARKRGGSNVPAQVGKGGSPVVAPIHTPHTTTSTSDTPPSPTDTTDAPQTQTVAEAPTSSGGGGGVPTPILVLGGLALLLAAAGAAGAGFRRLRRRS